MGTFTGGTINSDMLPSQPGINVGSLAQKFDGFFRNITNEAWISNNSPSAQDGSIRLASPDFIAWRNNADTADVALSKDTSDVLTYDGGFKADTFQTSSNPAHTGTVRLGAGDTFKIRDIADLNDLAFLSKDSSDRIVIGDTPGIQVNRITSELFPYATAGFLCLGNQEPINWRNSTDTANNGIYLDNNNRLACNALNGLVLSGTNPHLRLGGATSAFPMLKRNASALNLRLADDSADADVTVGALTASNGIVSNAGLGSGFGSFFVNNKITTYNGRATASEGVASILAAIDLQGQNAAISTANLVNTAPAGMYRVSYYLAVTTTGNAVNLTGTIGWNNGAAARTVTTANIACNALNDSSLIGQAGSITFYSAAAQAITYATALSGAIGLGFYMARFRVEFLG